MKPGKPLRRLTPLRAGTPPQQPWEKLTESEQEEVRQRAYERRRREKATRLAAMSPDARLAYQQRLLLVQARRIEKAERQERDAKAAAKKQWQRLRTAVWERDHGQCVRCGCSVVTYGDGEPMECHHRKLRSQGGPDVTFNLVALCAGCHRWAHSERTESEPLGLIVPSHGDPASTPVTYFDGQVRLLAERNAA